MVRMLGTLVFGLLITARAAAQTATVSGTVVDQTGGAVPGATVRLAGAGGASLTTTGPAGQYAFRTVAGGHLPDHRHASGLRARHAGRRRRLDRQPRGAAHHARACRLSDTVVVSASRSEPALIDAPATMSVVTSSVLASTPAQNYGDLLRRCRA